MKEKRDVMLENRTVSIFRTKNLCIKIIIFVWCTVFAFILSLMSQQNIFSGSSPYTDSSVFMTVAKSMLQGKVPYRDIFDHKGPYLYLLNCIGYALAEIKGVWIIEYLTILTAVLFSFFSVSLLYDKKIAVLSISAGYLTLTHCFEGGNYTEEYVLPLICIGLYCYIRIIKEQNHSTICELFCGLTFGLSLMLRPNMFSTWAVFSVYLILHWMLRKEFSRMIRFVLLFSAGTLLGVVPFFLYLTKNHALQDYIFQNFTVNAQYATYGLSLKRLIINLFESVYSLSYSIILGLVSCIIGIVANKNKECRRTLNLLLLISLFVSLVFVCTSQSIYGHYYMVLIPVIAVAFGAIFDLSFLLIRPWGLKNSAAFIVSAVVTLFVCFNSIYGMYMKIDARMAPQFRNSDKEVKELCRKIEKVAEEGDTLQVLGNSCHIYLYTSILPANKYIYDFPVAHMVEDVHNDFVDEWSKQPPDIVVVEKNQKKKYEHEKDTHSMWLLKELNTKYKKYTESAEYVIYHRKIK